MDHDVPVLRAVRFDGTLLAIVFGYACHCTVLDINKFCGDYAGFAQVELETRHRRRTGHVRGWLWGRSKPDPTPGPRAGCHVWEDSSRTRRRASSLAHYVPSKGHWDRLMKRSISLSPSCPTKSRIELDARSDNFYVASRARHLLKTIEARGASSSRRILTRSRPGGWVSSTWFFLGGEVVVDYSLRIKRNLGSSRTWVSAYCNDVMAYIPSKRVLKEGGYEGATAMIYYGQPAVWSETVEEAIIEAVARLSGTIRADRPPTAAPNRRAGR